MIKNTNKIDHSAYLFPADASWMEIDSFFSTKLLAHLVDVDSASSIGLVVLKLNLDFVNVFLHFSRFRILHLIHYGKCWGLELEGQMFWNCGYQRLSI